MSRIFLLLLNKERFMRAYMIASALLMTGCATVPPTDVPISSKFSKSDVAWFNSAGTGKLEGSAFLRTRGGEIRTCAGYEVQLLPYSSYAAERMKFIYGSETSGHLVGPRRAWKFNPDEPDFYEFFKKTVCDANGEFEFKDLPAGDYYTTAKVTWDIGKVFDEGGVLMRKVSIVANATETVSLTAN